MYEDRAYRKEIGENLENFLLVVEETDLWVGITKGFLNENLKNELRSHIISYREFFKKYIELDPDFASSLKPYQSLKEAPEHIKKMSHLSFSSDVGPMAGVAGAFSLIAGDFLINKNIPQIIVENGGDIFVYGFEKISTGIYAGKSPFSGKIKIEIELEKKIFGICSSSGSFGHSLSFGKADLVTIISENVIYADLLATDICNKVKSKNDVDYLINDLQNNKEISGAIIILEEKLGAFGNLQIKGLS